MGVVSDMKKIMVQLLLIAGVLLPVASVSAVYNPSLGSPRFPVIYQNSSHITYLNQSSIVQLENTPDYILWAQVQIPVDNGNQGIPYTRMFYYPITDAYGSTHPAYIGKTRIILPPYAGEGIAFYSDDLGSSWKPFDIRNGAGANAELYEGFNRGLESPNNNPFNGLQKYV